MLSLNDPAVYMRLRGHPPTIVVECAVCPKQFPACEGIAFPVKNPQGEIIMGAFCGAECYLAAMPVPACYRA